MGDRPVKIFRIVITLVALFEHQRPSGQALENFPYVDFPENPFAIWS